MEEERLQKLAEFESTLYPHFDFLTRLHGMQRSAVRFIDWGDPRYAEIVVRYRNEALRIDVGWTVYAQSFGVLAYLDHLGDSHFVHLEPYLEYITAGAEEAIVPYLKPRGRFRHPGAVISGCEKVFRLGLDEVARRVAERLRQHIPTLERATIDSVRGYHAWIEGKTTDS